MDKVKIIPSNLNGKIKVPSSKSLCHRAIIAAGLSKGNSKIENIVLSDDVIATINGMRALGANIRENGDSLIINGDNFLNIKGSEIEIDCIESGSTLRFLIPIALLTGKRITFKGRGRLMERPLAPYYNIFEEQNINYNSSDVLLLGGRLKPGNFKLEGNISSQFITGLMFALPLLDKDSSIHITNELESKGYVDLTIDILKRFSIDIENDSYKRFYIKGNQKYKRTDYRVEGDFSQAAFWLAAGILGEKVECIDVNINSLQGDRKIVEIIKEMGGNILIQGSNIATKQSKTMGITIDASNCPDIVPIISVLGALSEGTTRIVNAGRLRIKESDRLKAISTELKRIGADIFETKDGLIINGREMLGGGEVDSWKDHRIAMSLAVASIRSKEPVIITNSDAVRKSYPDFFKDFAMLGGDVEYCK